MEGNGKTAQISIKSEKGKENKEKPARINKK